MTALRRLTELARLLWASLAPDPADAASPTLHDLTALRGPRA